MKFCIYLFCQVTNVIGSCCVSAPEPSSCLNVFIFVLTAEVNK